ncbi:hypothetical protein B0H67DRAFT_52973 [Lasiosphaeris hirsuta]|uniref:Uncharacterized protein n=1 Tax=Lasiosphaeris hirsuta TaxID=260670 RepID=A0AA40E787_9PEZI|nr:hypothetical protein B0H67DRAFT_52973 [Lasiosphaeris hirsuta]
MDGETLSIPRGRRCTAAKSGIYAAPRGDRWRQRIVPKTPRNSQELLPKRLLALAVPGLAVRAGMDVRASRTSWEVNRGAGGLRRAERGETMLQGKKQTRQHGMDAINNGQWNAAREPTGHTMSDPWTTCLFLCFSVPCCPVPTIPPMIPYEALALSTAAAGMLGPRYTRSTWQSSEQLTVVDMEFVLISISILVSVGWR